MLPILYPSNTSTSGFFGNNGLGFFNRCLKCEVTEERNGIYELAMTILPSDRLAQSVICGMFIKVKPNPFDDPQIFEIYAVSVNFDKIEIAAQHIHYLLNTTVSNEPPGLQTGTPQQIWDTLQTQQYWIPANIFTFTSDIATTNTIYAGRVSAYDERNISATELLGGTEGSMLDVFGGEYHYDNFTIKFMQRRGSDTGVALRYGSNISSKQQDSDNNTMYSYIMPYARVKTHQEDTKEDRELYITISDGVPIPNSTLTYQKALLYDFSDKMSDFTLKIIRTGVFDNMAEAKARLLQEAENYVNKHNAALISFTVNIEINIADTLAGLSNCKLCDTILIDFDGTGTTARAKIIKTVYDSLGEKYIKMELGQPKKTIADMITVKNLGGA